jgi:ribosomal protein L7/L12
MARGSDSDISEIKQRLALLESRMEQVMEHLDIAPRNAPSGGGWWGGSDDDGPEQLTSSADADPKVQELIAGGNKIEAIKRYHELTGLGLKESKDAVDRLDG